MGEQWVDVTGGRVWCEVVGSGDATPLVCVHGGPGIPSAYLDSLRAIADERPVVFYDQLGCGRSDRPETLDHYHAERFVEELQLVRDALGLGRIHLFGQSWGGMLALMYALAYPPGLVSLTLASAVIDVTGWVSDCNELKALLPEETRITIDHHERHGFTSCPEYAAASLEWWRRHVCRVRPFPDELERALAGMGTESYEAMWGPSEFRCTGNLRDVNLSGRLGELTAPTLFTCGRHDESTPASNAAFAADVRNAELVVFEDSAHMAHLEERDAYIDTIRRFLAGTQS
jgi:proline-specific peptidase